MGGNLNYIKQRENQKSNNALLVLAFAKNINNIIMLPTHVNNNKWVELLMKPQTITFIKLFVNSFK